MFPVISDPRKDRVMIIVTEHNGDDDEDACDYGIPYKTRLLLELTNSVPVVS